MRRKRKVISDQVKPDKLKRQDLIKVLDLLKYGLSTKEIVEQTTHYLFMGDKIATYNDMICIVASFNTGFFGSVRSGEFYKLLSKVSDDYINLILQEGQFVINAGRSSFGLAYMEPGKIHEMVGSLDHDDLEWENLSKEMKEGLVICAFSASKDMTSPVYTGVYVDGNDILSTDRYRISWCRIKDSGASFLIPASSAICLLHYDLDYYSVTDSWIHFKGKDLIFSSRLLAEEFPKKTKTFFPGKLTGGFHLPDGFDGALDKACVLLEQDFDLDKQVEIEIKKEGILICQVEKEGLGWFKEEFELGDSFEYEDLKLITNPIFLREILRYKPEIIPVDENRLLFTSDNFSHLVSLK